MFVKEIIVFCANAFSSSLFPTGKKASKNLKKSQKPNFDRRICFAQLKPVSKRIDSSKSSPFKLHLKPMENDRIFAFSLRTGSIMPNYLYHEDSSYTRPSANGLTWSDRSKYTELYTKFNLLLKQRNFFGIHRIQDANIFYQVCKLIEFIKDYSFSK